jgi:hypothetical protein
MTAIGEGYSWPNLTIFSDGFRTALISQASSRPESRPFRYVGSYPIVAPSLQFEEAVDSFITQIIGRLREARIRDSNLDVIWRELLAERSDPRRAERRKLEALLGRDPDEAEDPALDRLLADAKAVGEGAINEIAADHGQGGDLLSLEALRAIANEKGLDASPRDAVRLAPTTRLSQPQDVVAWRLGAEAAVALRVQLNLGATQVHNALLANLAGVQEKILQEKVPGPSISFALDGSTNRSRIVLRSKWETGRRFELARLLGDRLVWPGAGKLFPATRAYTYRQKMQRSFAAEFLSPFEAIDEMMSGDYSMENQLDAAEQFDVSPLTIRTLLVNNGRIERDELDHEPDLAAA